MTAKRKYRETCPETKRNFQLCAGFCAGLVSKFVESSAMIRPFDVTLLDLKSVDL